MLAVVDTNVIVSALLYPSSLPAEILDMILKKEITLLYDNRIMAEYINVTYREKFKINKEILKDVFEFIEKDGVYISSKPLDMKFTDETDKKFYEVYQSGQAQYLITGNIKHFPKEAGIVTPGEFLTAVYE